MNFLPLLLAIFFIFSLRFDPVYCKDENYSESLNKEFRLNGTQIQNAFGSSKEKALNTTVRLIRNHKLIALGTMINPEGFLLTKASSCVGAREAVLANGEVFPLRIRKRFEELDLALYQLITEKNDFEFVRWKEKNQTSEISWVLSAFTKLEEIRIGLASGKQRPIGREGGVMGVLLGREGKNLGGVEISEVVPHAAAYRAGLLALDLIVKVDGRKVSKRDQVIKIVGAKDPGDLINLEIKRGERTKFLKVTLGHKSVTFDLFNRNLQMSGPVSKRKDNFPLILQHDLPLPKEAMGGSLFDLDGNCIGINIARVDRVTTFSLPAKIIKPYIEEWLIQE